MVKKKYTSSYSKAGIKKILFGWKVKNKIFRTKFMAEKYANKLLKDNKRKQISIIPLYKI